MKNIRVVISMMFLALFYEFDTAAEIHQNSLIDQYTVWQEVAHYLKLAGMTGARNVIGVWHQVGVN